MNDRNSPGTRRNMLRASLGLLGTLALLCTLAPRVSAQAGGNRYIQVRITKVMIGDDMDPNSNGEMRYVVLASTGNRGRGAISTQTSTFPFERWLEVDEAGANSAYMGVGNQGIPVFNFPESEMGDSLVFSVAVLDDDSNPGSLLLVHDLARAAGVAVATAFTGPAGGAIVKVVSDRVHAALSDMAADEVGIVTAAHGRGDRFGTAAGGTFTNDIQSSNGRLTVSYNIRRVGVPASHDDWCAAVKLKRVKIIGDADPWPKGEGEVYIRARVADGFTNSGNSSTLHQRTTALPASGGTRSVDEGKNFPLPAGGTVLYTNLNAGRCVGLPPFLFIEIDVLEDDDESDPDIIGVLPIVVSNGWMREHPGITPVTYRVRGADSDEKAEITFDIEIWDPNAIVQ